MPVVPKRVERLTAQDIFEFGAKGVSDDTVFDFLELTPKQRETLRRMPKWFNPYRRGRAHRELELAKTMNETKDTQLIKEILKGTSIVQQKTIDDDVEFVIDAPEWLKAKQKSGHKGKRAKISN